MDFRGFESRSLKEGSGLKFDRNTGAVQEGDVQKWPSEVLGCRGICES